MNHLGTSVLFAVLAGVLSVGFTLCSSSKNKHPLVAGVISAIVMLVITWLSIGLLMPDFSFPINRGPWGAWFFGIFTTLVVSGTVAFFCAGLEEYGENEGSWTSGLVAVGIGVVFLIATGITAANNPPGIYSDDGHKQIWDLLNLTNAEKGTTGADLDINVALRVSPGHAKQKALAAIPRDGNIGSYLHVGEPYLQGIKLNGAKTAHPYYVCALTVADARSYSNAGNEVPGYILIDATDKDAPAQWIKLDPDHTIKYVQKNAQFFSPWDLDRHVYFDYNLPRQVRTIELEGMEVDDNLQPWYVASVMQPVAGINAYYPTGILVINPHTGEIKEYPLGQTPDQVPDWIDRRLPVSTSDQLVSEWAEYANHKIVGFADTNQGKKKIDDESLVWSPDGLLLQYVLTSVGSDVVASDLAYVNPRTMTAMRYDVQGVIQSKVREMMQTVAKSQKVVDFDVSILQIEWIAGKQVWYGVLEKDQKYWGVALMQTVYAQAMDTSKIIIDPDLETAVQQLRVQIATDAASGQNGQISNASQFTQVDGTIDRIGSNTVSADGRTLYGNFTLKTTYQGQQTLIVCRYLLTIANTPYAYIHEGDRVTVTLLSVNTDKINDTISIVNHTYRVIIAIPSSAPTPTTAPSQSPKP